MLKKLIKYDLKYYFKLWWIFALAIVGISFVSGILVSISSAQAETSETAYAIYMFITMLLYFLTFMGIGIFAISPTALSGFRFQKNFFTDEGYLTFTLPVKKTQLINSKVISTMLLTIATYLVSAIGVIIFMAFASPQTLFDAADWLAEFFRDNSIWATIISISIIILVILLSVSSSMLVFVSISISNTLVKKARIVVGIGIYYVINSAISMFLRFFIYAIPELIYSTSANALPSIAAAICSLIVFSLIISTILYIVQYFIIDKKLNLA